MKLNKRAICGQSGQFAGKKREKRANGFEEGSYFELVNSVIY